MRGYNNLAKENDDILVSLVNATRDNSKKKHFARFLCIISVLLVRSFKYIQNYFLVGYDLWKEETVFRIF